MGVLPVSETQSRLPPAGWYPDPAGAPQKRWWDGTGWTVHNQIATEAVVAPVAAAAVMPVFAMAQPSTAQPSTAQPSTAQPSTVHASTSLPSTAAALPFAATPFTPQSPATSQVLPTATGAFEFAFQPAVAAGAGDAAGPVAFDPFDSANFPARGQSGSTASAAVLDYTMVPTGWATRGGLLIALMPAIQLVMTIGMFWLWINVGLALISVFLISMLPWCFTLIAAIFDRRKLFSLGFERPPHWAWIFIGPWLYLILRVIATRREMGGGAAILSIWFASGAVASIGGTAAFAYLAALA